MKEKTLTVGKIAQYCQVEPRTVFNWLVAGKLKSYRTPGRHSRVTLQDFLAFLETYKLPVPDALKPSPNRPKRILVVDDDKTTVRLIEGILEKDHYQIEVAHNGFMAGLKISEFRPDLITLDLKMPQLDGFEVLKIVRAYPHNKDTKIIVVSAYLDDDVIKQVLDLGADDYLKKPIDRKALEDKINKIFSGLTKQSAAVKV